MMSSLIPVTSPTNGLTYYVLDDSPMKSARILSRLEFDLQTLVGVLSFGVADDPVVREGIRRLRMVVPPGSRIAITELDGTRVRQIAMNKGKKRIFLCLKKYKRGELANYETLLYIAIHELVHTMDPIHNKSFNGKTKHSDRFLYLESYMYALGRKKMGFRFRHIDGVFHCHGTINVKDDHMNPLKIKG